MDHPNQIALQKLIDKFSVSLKIEEDLVKSYNFQNKYIELTKKQEELHTKQRIFNDKYQPVLTEVGFFESILGTPVSHLDKLKYKREQLKSRLENEFASMTDRVEVSKHLENVDRLVYYLETNISDLHHDLQYFHDEGARIDRVLAPYQEQLAKVRKLHFGYYSLCLAKITEPYARTCLVLIGNALKHRSERLIKSIDVLTRYINNNATKQELTDEVIQVIVDELIEDITNSFAITAILKVLPSTNSNSNSDIEISDDI